jgi:predicted trehalose synthase
MSPNPPGIGAAANEAEFARWVHRLRNELNTVSMASAAAAGLYAAGDEPSARANLQRVQDACKRCSSLLAEPPAGSSGPAGG